MLVSSGRMKKKMEIDIENVIKIIEDFGADSAKINLECKKDGICCQLTLEIQSKGAEQ